jgi:hypothetical protein
MTGDHCGNCSVHSQREPAALTVGPGRILVSINGGGERYTITNANLCAARIFNFVISKVPPKLPRRNKAALEKNFTAHQN